MRKTVLLATIFIFHLLANAQNFNLGLSVGDYAPPFARFDQNNDFISSSELLKDHPVVLIFYRGYWCPVCKRHLANLQDSLELIRDKGASVVVVTPEQSSSIKKTISKTGATFSILHDEDYEIMKMYQVDYKITKETVSQHYPFVLEKTKNANGNNDRVLPVPATYLIGQDGTVHYVHFDTDYHNRASIREILSILN